MSPEWLASPSLCVRSQGTQKRLGSGYVEIPVPVPLLILRDPPGDGSYAKLESSISTAVKLTQVQHNKLTCGGMGNSEVFTKSLFWNLFNAIPFYKVRLPQAIGACQQRPRSAHALPGTRGRAHVPPLCCAVRQDR